MPQLDTLGYYNQILGLLIAFAILLTAFYAVLVKPYTQLVLFRKSVSTLARALAGGLRVPVIGVFPKATVACPSPQALTRPHVSVNMRAHRRVALLEATYFFKHVV